ncbi:MAG: ABC transporter permease [Defluviitaleaceae bacterium]|nr:ABC transporter permease [Defluviitaleaceae bacterium]
MNLTVLKFALIRGLKSPVSMIVNYALPFIILIFMFDYSDGNEPSRGYFGLAMAIMFGAFYMAKSIQNDKIDGAVIRILAGPVTMRSYLVQNFLATMIPLSAIVAIISALGIIMYGWAFSLAVGLLLCYAFLGATSVGLSFVWSCLFKNKESGSVLYSMLMMVIILLCGLLIPLDALPAPLFYIGAIFPAHWASRAIEALLEYGGFVGIYWLSLLAMLLFAAAYLLYGGKRRII